MRRGPVIVLLLALLIFAGYAARRLERQSWDTLVRYTPPHAREATVATRTAPAPALASRLVLVMVDGLSADDALNLPTLAYLHDQGAYSTLQAPATPWPRTAWAELLTGAPPDLNGTVAGPQELRALTADNLLSAARRSGKSVAAAGDPTLGALVQPWLDRGFLPVPGTATSGSTQLVDWLRAQVKSGGPDLVLVQLAYPHAAAHKAGADTEANHAALAAVDAVIAQFLDAVDLHSTAIAVVGDLPAESSGAHLDTAAGAAPFIVAGPGIVPGSAPDCQLEDVAPTLAELLGTSLPGWAAGEPQWGMLRVEPASLTARLQAEVAQQRAFFGAYTKIFGYQVVLPAPMAQLQTVHDYVGTLQSWAERAHQTALRAGILHRLPWVAGAWLLILLYIWLLSRQPYGLSLSLGALAYTVLYYGVFFLRGGRYSLQMPGLETMGPDLLGRQLWVSAGIMVVTSIYLGWHLGRRGFRRGAYVCLIALHTGMVTVGLVAAPALIPVLTQGINFRWFVPAAGWSLFYFFSLQQIIVIGFGAPLWMFLTLVAARLTVAGARTEAEAAAGPRVISLPDRRHATRPGRSRSY